MGLYQEVKEAGRAFIIAEIGVNYYDIARKEGIEPFEAARMMIDRAEEGGADAVKFQTYKADRIASRDSPAYWDRNEEPTETQYRLFRKFDKFGREEYSRLADYCRDRGIIFMSTPFDFESADYLDELMPVYKVSSSDLTNIPFIRHIAGKGKPVFLSTGAATLGEIEHAVNTVREAGNDQICIMHCVLDYPTGYENANLNMIKHLGRVFPGYLLGFSDHTRPDEAMLVVTAAYLFGATVIEKHFTLDKNLRGNDHYHAMDPEDLKRFRSNLELLNSIGGEHYKHPLECERDSRTNARRSIVAEVDMKKGDEITRDRISFKRPGTGISPADLDKVMGRRINRNIRRDEIIKWEDL